MTELKAQIINPRNEKRSPLSYSMPAYIKWPVKMLEKVSPRLILPFALKLFFTPLKFPTPSREMSIARSAHREIGYLGNREFEILRWGERGPMILLMHGWSGRATQFFKIIEALLSRGYQVLAINAPAHGGLSGKQTHLFEFVDAIKYSLKKYGEPVAAIGHSLGGLALFNAFVEHPKPPKMLIIGSPANISNVIHDFSKTIGGSEKLARHIIKSIEKQYNLRIAEASSDYLARHFNPPGMIIHDLEDRDVPVENAVLLHKNWKNSQLLLSEGYGHRKILMEPRIIERILHFIEE